MSQARTIEELFLSMSEPRTIEEWKKFFSSYASKEWYIPMPFSSIVLNRRGRAQFENVNQIYTAFNQLRALNDSTQDRIGADVNNTLRLVFLNKVNYLAYCAYYIDKNNAQGYSLYDESLACAHKVVEDFKAFAETLLELYIAPVRTCENDAAKPTEKVSASPDAAVGKQGDAELIKNVPDVKIVMLDDSVDSDFDDTRLMQIMTSGEINLNSEPQGKRHAQHKANTASLVNSLTACPEVVEDGDPDSFIVELMTAPIGTL